MKELLLAIFLGWAGAHAQDTGVDEIMLRVALNQAKAQEARQQFVYRQKQVIRLGRSNGKVAHEERREYRVTPAARGYKKEMVTLDGRYEENGKFVAYHGPVSEHNGIGTSIDAGLVEALGEGLTGDPDSRDGIAGDLFPLTYHQQLKYTFRLMGRETYRGRAVYRVAFEPKKDFEWKGEAVIDAEEYQPVFVTTKMAHRIPLVIRTVFGTNLHGLGFSLSYEKFDDGVWFPVSYGGEFELRAVFFYRRNISISMTNSDFRRAAVVSNVTYSTDPQ